MVSKKHPKSKEAFALSPTLLEEFLRFVEYHPASRFGKNLRNMLLEFLQFDGAIEAGYLNDLLYDLEGLFALLDVIEAEGKQNKQGAR
jgi:hypothetical protein